jgi:hypothetical protein
MPYIQRLEGTSTETGEQVDMECPSVYSEVPSYAFVFRATLFLTVLLSTAILEIQVAIRFVSPGNKSIEPHVEVERTAVISIF